MKGKHAVLTVLAVTATTAGTVLTVAPSAIANETLCSSGEMVHHNPNDGRDYCFDEIAPGIPSLTDFPAEGTGGLILRDENGNDLGSGIGEGQAFQLTECGPEGSGLIKVNQTLRGEGGGWGELYDGYVKVEWTSLTQGGSDTYKDACPTV